MGAPGAEERGTATMRCCRDHANYYAQAWAYGPVVLYPAMRDVVWIEILP